MLASGSSDKTVRIWYAMSGEYLQLEGHTEEVTSVSWSGDGKMLASGSIDNTVRIWNATSGKCIQTLRGHTGWVYSVSWSRKSKMLASGSLDKTVRIWIWNDDENKFTYQHNLKHTAPVYLVSWRADDNILASVSPGMNTQIIIWDMTIGYIQKLRPPGSVTAMSWSGDGKMIASAAFHSELSKTGTIQIWK